MLDLSEIAVVDNHCHGVFSDTAPVGLDTYRHRFTECAGEPFGPEHTSSAIHYLWAIRQLAGALECDPTEEAVLAARAALSQEQLDARFLRAANIAWLLVDDGYPDPADVEDREGLARRGGFQVGWVERVESVAERLAAKGEKFALFDEDLRDHLASARARGVCGLKTVAAYRSGLAIGWHDRDDVHAAYKRMRRMPRPRVSEQPLVDHIVSLTMEAAAEQDLPVQFHTGYGDSDADLLLASPLHLAPLLRRFPSVAVVMLHGSYPYTREAAVLAATYPNAYVDVSYAIPFLTSSELYAVTHQAIAAAPVARVMYSSDAVGLPEQHWLGAVRGRRALGAALGDLVALGDITAAQGRSLAELVLRGNAERIYQLV